IRTTEEVITSVFTENGAISVEGNVANSSVEATGTPANEAFNTYNADMTITSSCGASRDSGTQEKSQCQAEKSATGAQKKNI
ncbi:MAG: hypothetical protein J6R40_05960, partial [Clostridia bacterium]|nr:hypothetical protein [Clostridia bacterium]